MGTGNLGKGLSVLRVQASLPSVQKPIPTLLCAAARAVRILFGPAYSCVGLGGLPYNCCLEGRRRLGISWLLEIFKQAVFSSRLTPAFQGTYTSDSWSCSGFRTALSPTHPPQHTQQFLFSGKLCAMPLPPFCLHILWFTISVASHLLPRYWHFHLGMSFSGRGDENVFNLQP